MADPEFAAMKANALQAHLSIYLSNFPVEVLTGEKIVEVRLREVHKGKVVQSLLTDYQQDGHFLVAAMGDDQTDEDMFAALPVEGVAIHVGSRDSLAAYRLADPIAARRFLKQILSV